MADDDPVVQEFDVYLAKTLEEHLHLYQYPLRPKSVSYDDATIVEARVKPHQQKVELELALSTQSRNFDPSRAEQIASVVNSNCKESGPYFPRNIMDKHLLASSKVMGCASRYAVGLIRDGDLHLSPVSSVMHLRPHFKYLDVGVSKGQQKGQKTGDAGDSSQEEEEEAKQITVRFARTETDKAKKAREKSYHYIQQKTADEAWINVTCNPYKSEASTFELSRLQCIKTKADAQSQHVPKTEYIKMFIPQVSDSDFDQPNLPSSVISMAQLNSMPLGDQVKTLLVNAKVIKFSQLMILLPSGVESLVVLRSLQQVAVLVQGNWVVKSDVLYPKGSCSTFTGISADLLCKARDYIMWRFTQTPTITRKEVSSLVKLPNEDLKDILEHMARARPVIGWTFSLPNDDAFLKRYPDVVQRQQMIWEAKSQQLVKLKSSGTKGKDGFDVSAGLKSPTKIRVRKRTKSSSQDAKSDDSDRESRADQPDDMEVDTDGATTSTALSSSLIGMAGNRVVNGSSGAGAATVLIKREVVDPSYGDESASIVNGDISGQGGAGLMSGSSPSAEFLQELTEFVRDSFVTYPCLTVTELKRVLNCKLAQSPPGHILRKGVSDKLLDSVCRQVGCEQLNLQWPVPLREPAIFVTTKVGDQVDPLKKAFLDVFRSAPRSRKGLIKKTVEDALGISLGDADFNKLLKDYCIPLKSGYFLIKYVNPALVS